jgi:hypothetical protein
LWVVVFVLFGVALVAPHPTLITPANALGGFCSRTSVGYVPLTDGLGLYETGNDVPAAHADNAPEIAPIGGVVGLVSLGMSNASQEWDAFTGLIEVSSGVAGDVRVANGSVGGQTMAEWSVPGAPVWADSIDRIRESGLSTDQVQVVWMKMGSQLHELAPTEEGRTEQERAWLQAVITNAANTFPNLKRIYISSRIYAGYTSNNDHSEPETGWGNGLSVRTLVSDSVAGATAVWTAWGPYLWADGLTGRSDGLTWECDDFETDGVHPSMLGEQKVAELLFDFFAGEPGACEWFLADPSQCGTTGGGGGGGGGGVTTPTFDDVAADHTFYADIEGLADRGITLGCNLPENSLFCPDETVTRGQMAAFLERALDLPKAGNRFSDDDNSVFETSINSIAAAGITEGCNPPTNSLFCPADPVTRGQMAAFLVRAFDLPSWPINVFEDDDGSVFEADIQALARSEITQGCNPPVNDQFCPGEPITRAEMAAFLHRSEPYLP